MKLNYFTHIPELIGNAIEDALITQYVPAKKGRKMQAQNNQYAYFHFV